MTNYLENTLSWQMPDKTAVLSLGGSFQGGRKENTISKAYPGFPNANV